MAGIAYVKIRLWNPDAVVGDDSNVLPNKLRKHTHEDSGGYKQLFEVFWSGATQAAFEEFGTAPTAAKDGRVTPYQIIAVSAGVGDADGGTSHVRKVAIIGLTYEASDIQVEGGIKPGAEPRMTVEVMNMNGTTDVTSVLYYIRVIHAYACDWGSGGSDASAAITIEAPANTTLLAIAINQNESEGCTLYFPANRFIAIEHATIVIHDATFAAIADGILVTFTTSAFENALQDEEDFPSAFIVANEYNPNVHVDHVWLQPRLTSTAGTSSLIAGETLIANSEDCTVNFNISILENP